MMLCRLSGCVPDAVSPAPAPPPAHRPAAGPQHRPAPPALPPRLATTGRRHPQVGGVNIDHDTLYVPWGKADIFFPTDFDALCKLYRRAAQQVWGEGGWVADWRGGGGVRHAGEGREEEEGSWCRRSSHSAVAAPPLSGVLCCGQQMGLSAQTRPGWGHTLPPVTTRVTRAMPCCMLRAAWPPPAQWGRWLRSTCPRASS